MDGFYVAKFKVEKRLKTKPKEESTVDMDMEAMDVDGEAEPSGFNSDEDREYIEGPCLFCSATFLENVRTYRLFSLLFSFRVETEGHESQGTPCPSPEKACTGISCRQGSCMIFLPVLRLMYFLLTLITFPFYDFISRVYCFTIHCVYGV